MTRAAASNLVRPQRGDAPVDTPAAPVAPARHVLLVDDQVDVRTSLSVMIRTLGYDVHAVDGGRAALSWLETQSASLVITDLGMPGMSGRELAAAIAKRHQALPVVLLTGWADGEPEGPPWHRPGAAQAAPDGATPRCAGQPDWPASGIITPDRCEPVEV